MAHSKSQGPWSPPKCMFPPNHADLPSAHFPQHSLPGTQATDLSSSTFLHVYTVPRSQAASSNLFYSDKGKKKKHVWLFLQPNNCSPISQLSLVKVMSCTTRRCMQGHNSQHLLTAFLPVLVGNWFHHSCIKIEKQILKISHLGRKNPNLYILHILKKTVLFFHFSPIRKML